ncbi:MAG: TraB/GumN family protein [Flavobacteriales bacterium]|nr:TraB/GumN family protein [Flavobacteriales bacterium]
MRIRLLIVLIAPLVSHAQEKSESTLLWRITTPGVARTSYLYGTVHSKDDRAFQFTDSVLPALDRCAIAAGELDLSADKQMGMALLTNMRMSGGTKLADLYKKKEWSRVEAMMQERVGFMAPMLASVKPFFVLAIMTENDMNDAAGERTVVLDQYLQQRAASNGRRVIGIETVAEQIAAIDAVPLKVQAAMLLDYVDNGGFPGAMDALLDAYASEDLDALMKEAMKAGGMPEQFERSLLTERNGRMVERMDKLLREEGSLFFLIGAAHLPSPTGLIAGLRTKGHTVEAVLSGRSAPVRRVEPVLEEH